MSGAVITIRPEPEILVLDMQSMSMLHFSISWSRKACVASCLTDLTFQQPTFILDFACLMSVVGFSRFMALKGFFDFAAIFKVASPAGNALVRLASLLLDTRVNTGAASLAGDDVAVTTFLLGLISIDVSWE